ncbi:uncharacterized protein [Apostichopus japonicus]|uniref:uncharacterized protein n=1 Tax=Stichopus japonicus TaxID=307972 RepID=UPI003AB48095
MLEPGDISVSYNRYDPRPYPGPEPPNPSRGKPVFLGRHDDRTRLNVGQTYQDVIRIKGERDVTVLFQEQDFTDTSKWHDLKTLTLGESDAGFTLSFTVQRRHYAGIHHFKYTAENAKGGAILTRTLQINQQTSGG